LGVGSSNPETSKSSTVTNAIKRAVHKLKLLRNTEASRFNEFLAERFE